MCSITQTTRPTLEWWALPSSVMQSKPSLRGGCSCRLKFGSRLGKATFTKGHRIFMNGLKTLKQIGVAATLVLLLNASLVHSQVVQGDQGSGVLKEVADIPMPGPAVRFDYQSLDAKNGRLYIAHMNADQLVVFDIQKRQVVANLDGFKGVHGVIAVPEIDRVFASATGEHK